jgi:hypothetical protein
MSTTKIGKIIFYNGRFGFIKTADSVNNIFFTKNSISYEQPNILDIVEFEIELSKNLKKIGTFVAKKIKLIKKNNLLYDDEFKCYIGIVKHKAKNHYYIDYPAEIKNIILFPTRLQYDKKIKVNDIVIFCPVISDKDKNNLFSLFAYKIEHELDGNYIVNNITYKHPILQDWIIRNDNRFDLNEKSKLILDLIKLTKNNSYYNINDLIKIIKGYGNTYKPSWKDLENHITINYIIHLWLIDLVSDYDTDIIKNNFLKFDASYRKTIIDKITNTDKIKIIKHYAEHAKSYNHLNNKHKEILKYINELSENINDIHIDEIINNIKRKANNKENIDLWLKGYDLNYTNEEIKSYLNDDIITSLSENKISNSKISNIICSIYVDKITTIIKNNTELNDEFTYELINKLNYLIENYKATSLKLVKALSQKYTTDQLFRLNMLGLNIDDDYSIYVNENINNIDIYLKIKYTLKNSKHNKIDNLIDKKKIENDLLNYCDTITWNNLIYPTEILGNNPLNIFIKDINDISNKLKIKMDVDMIANKIFEKTESNELLKVRLWMYYFKSMNEKYIDYYNYKEPFFELNRDEQTLYKEIYYDLFLKNKGNLIKSETVIPCVNYDEVKDKIKIYHARLNNIYFGNNTIELCTNVNEFTKKYYHKDVSNGLNEINEEHELNNYEIKITVDSYNNIIEIKGFDLIIEHIRNKQIDKALAKTITKPDNHKENKIYYVEDFKLISEIKHFLENQQSTDHEIIYIQEIKNKRKKIEVGDEGEIYELSALYTIKLNENYLIVWQNHETKENKATYLFKCNIEDYETIISRLKHEIKSTAQLKSFLISKNDKNEYQLYKRYLGYVANIKKEKGDETEFETWVFKFKNYRNIETPKMVIDDDQIKKIKEITELIIITRPGNNKTTHKPSYESEIKTSDLVTVDTSETIEANIKNTPIQMKLNKILTSLTDINSKL